MTLARPIPSVESSASPIVAPARVRLHWCAGCGCGGQPASRSGLAQTGHTPLPRRGLFVCLASAVLLDQSAVFRQAKGPAPYDHRASKIPPKYTKLLLCRVLVLGASWATPGSLSACGCGLGDAACGAPLPRSGGYARGSL